MEQRKNLFTVLGEWWDHKQADSANQILDKAPDRSSGWLPTRGNVLFTVILLGLFALAQTAGALPQARVQENAPVSSPTSTIAYQGRLADVDGAPITAMVSMIFRLYSQGSGGAPLWEEQWTGSNSVEVSDGLFNVMLGSLSAIPADVITGYDTLFLGITVGSDDEMAPRVQLGTVPFAVQALTVPDGSITGAKLAENSVDSSKIQDGQVMTADLAGEAVTAANIADGAVTQEKAPTLLVGPGSGYRVLAGRVTTHGLGGADVFFTPSFLEPPVVVGMAQGFNVQLYAQPTTNHAAFTIHSATEGVVIHWIAIGR